MKKTNGSVWWFFLIAIGFTWLFQLPQTLNSKGVFESPKLLLSLVRYLPPFGPFLAAFTLTYLSSGKDGVLRLLQRGWKTDFRRVWWIPTLLLLPTMEGLAITLARVFAGEAFPALPILTQPRVYAEAFLSLLCLALLEEYGWRGYALDRLQERWNALTASLILAALWGPWHLQQWFAGARDVPFFAFWYGLCLESILLTWLYNNTGRSLLPVILFHTLLNAQVFPTWNTKVSAISFVLVWTAVPILVVIGWGQQRLIRHRIQEEGWTDVPQ